MQTESPPAARQTPAFEPKRLPPTVELPEPRLYRIKNRLLGRPLHTEQLEHERLGKPTALAVFASDNLSSSSYATEEILRVLVPVVGVAAFSLVTPITLAMLGVLALLILSYRQTIKEYPSAGSAYLVTRDNFGQIPALVAGVSLLSDYVLTVAVSVAAGTAALTSAFGSLRDYSVPLALGFIVVIAYGNLRGVRESGRLFGVPTYFFILNMFLMLGLGFGRFFLGELPRVAAHPEGALELGDAGGGLLMGASLFVVLHAFASGGAAVTGVEAIADGVPAFRKPEWKNARTTLVMMGCLLGVMFLGLSILAAEMHVRPFEEGSPTVISQIGELVYGGGILGDVGYYSLQAGTMLILVLAANTSFADFPRLASFAAGDNFMPRQLTKRGHRLVFSNGIISLSIAAMVLVVLTGAKVERLIPLYAVGVFTSFTLSQASMTRHHTRKRQQGWQRGVAINGVGAAISFVVAVIIGVTKFTHGAWIIILAVPILVVLLTRLGRQYEDEAEELKEDAQHAAEAPILRRHVVLVLVDSLDLAAARAIQYARTLTPDELRAVHFDLDPLRTDELVLAWQRLGLSRLPLDVVECPDRRIARGIAEMVAQAVADGETEMTVLLPRRHYARFWQRLLHDRTAEQITDALELLPHCNVTLVPYHLGARRDTAHDVARALEEARTSQASDDGAVEGGTAPEGFVTLPGCTPIADVRHRQRTRVAGRIKSMRIQPWSGVATLECTLDDGSGALTIVFLGRRTVPGIKAGVRVAAEGVAGEHGGRLAMLNPIYEVLPEEAPDGGGG